MKVLLKTMGVALGALVILTVVIGYGIRLFAINPAEAKDKAFYPMMGLVILITRFALRYFRKKALVTQLPSPPAPQQ